MKPVALMLCNWLLFYSCNSNETLFPQFFGAWKKKRALDSKAVSPVLMLGFPSCLTCNVQGAGEETEEERRKYWSDKKFEKYVGLGKQLWALKICDSSITENEREGGDEKSIVYISEVSEFSEVFGALARSCFSWFPLMRGGVSGGWLALRVEQ